VDDHRQRLICGAYRRIMFSGLESPVHWLIVGVIALVVLGPKRLPEAGRSLGSGIRGFREALTGKDEDEKKEPEEAR
jgi:sec-independent protein translocase protein TatA